jgi:hypothetical protein
VSAAPTDDEHVRIDTSAKLHPLLQRVARRAGRLGRLLHWRLRVTVAPARGIPTSFAGA